MPEIFSKRFRVFDLNDAFCGVWYAASEVDAIAAAISEGYDAWSAVVPPLTGH